MIKYPRGSSSQIISDGKGVSERREVGRQGGREEGKMAVRLKEKLN